MKTLKIIQGIKLYKYIWNSMKNLYMDKRFGDQTLEDMYRCRGCGLSHKNVEAGGIWHCPNKACTISGNSYFRSQLKSYREEPDSSQHSVDLEEWEATVRELLPTITDTAIYAATEHSLNKLRGEIILKQ